MSSLEQSSPLYSFTPAAMGAGIVTTANARVTGVIPFLNGTSHITGIVRVTVGGAPGIPTATILPPTTADNAGNTLTTAVYQLRVMSSNVGDTSVYRVFWTNSYEASDRIPVGVSPAGVITVTVPAQYAP
jgi:hypothetical protein